MLVYDTLTRQKKPLLSSDPFTMYSCGVTVYDYSHIGHARSYIVWDVLKRWLSRSHEIFHVQNFTDVDDKIITRAQKEGVSSKEISERYIKAYFEDMDWLNVGRAIYYPFVTTFMDEMKAAAEQMVLDDHAYFKDGDIRFNGKNYKNYGQLTPKNEAEDFVIWKGAKPSEPEFPNGRPGWHLECSVMIECSFKKTIDLHVGGNDLIFPHHENEIAQSECLHRRQLARHWMHNGMVLAGEKKMGKSEGNAFNIRDYRDQGLDPNVIRYWILQASYGKPLSKDALDDGTAKNQWNTLKERLRDAPQKGVTEGFLNAMDNDLNTPLALSELLQNPTREMADILGFRLIDEIIPENIQILLQERDVFRQAKNWAEADKVKHKIIDAGYQIRDITTGTIVTKN